MIRMPSSPGDTSETRSAIRRDGVIINVGDAVTTDYPGCAGCIFIVDRITQWSSCESGFMILAHVEGERHRTLTGPIEIGIDTNWFKPHNHGSTDQKGYPDDPGKIDPLPDDAGRAGVIEDRPAPIPGNKRRRGGGRLGGQGNLDLFK